MKYYIITITAILLASVFSFASCKKKVYKPQFEDAIITGWDYRKCMCCGGLMITFANDPKPYSADFKLISNPNQDLGISDSTTFPMNVKVVWEKDTVRCSGQFIQIKRMLPR